MQQIARLIGRWQHGASTLVSLRLGFFQLNQKTRRRERKNEMEKKTQLDLKLTIIPFHSGPLSIDCLLVNKDDPGH